MIGFSVYTHFSTVTSIYLLILVATGHVVFQLRELLADENYFCCSSVSFSHRHDNYPLNASVFLFLSSCDRRVFQQILFPSYACTNFHMMLQKRI